MPDKSFEKQMEDLMGKLQMQPEKKVWEEVEKRIQNNGRKRRPVLWLALLLSVAGAGFWMFNGNDITQTIVNREVIRKVDTSQKIEISQSNEAVKSGEQKLFVEHKTEIKKQTRNENITSLLQNRSIQNRNIQDNVAKRENISSQQTPSASVESASSDLKSNKDHLTPDSSNMQTVEQKVSEDKKIMKTPKLNENTSEIKKTDAETKTPEWEKGFLFSAGVSSYTSGLRSLLNTNSSGVRIAESSANPQAGSPYTTTTYSQHASGGYYFNAGFFLQRNFKKFSLTAGPGLEYIRFSNYETVETNTYAAGANGTPAGGNVTSISPIGTSINNARTDFRFIGINLQLSVKGKLAADNKKSLYWMIGAPQQFLMQRSSSVSNNSSFTVSGNKKNYFISAVELGLSYTHNGKHKFSVSPYVNYNLKTIQVQRKVPVHLYKAGLQLQYYLK